MSRLFVLVALCLAACEGGGDEPRDPGRPAVPHGPKCAVTVSDAATKTELLQCTAIATISEGAAHLFLELYPDREPTLVQRYASVLLNTSDWQPGRYEGAIGGRIEIRLEDGRRYRLQAESGKPFPVLLDVDAVAEADSGDHYLLRGELNANVPRVSAGPQDYVSFKVLIE